MGQNIVCPTYLDQDLGQFYVLLSIFNLIFLADSNCIYTKSKPQFWFLKVRSGTLYLWYAVPLVRCTSGTLYLWYAVPYAMRSDQALYMALLAPTQDRNLGGRAHYYYYHYTLN